VEDERKPWDQMEDEPNRWFQRFSAYRLLGPGRSIEEVFRREREAKNGKAKRASSTWNKNTQKWNWKSRALAWDQHLNNLAEAEKEAAWRSKIMGETEALARMSEFGRNDMRQFFKASERWTEEPLPSEEILEEEEYVDPILGISHRRYKVKKVVLDLDALLDPERSFRVREFTDSPKNGLGLKLYDAPSAIVNAGKHNGAFTDKDDLRGSNTVRSISIPADLIAPPFLAPYRDIRDKKHTEYVLYGGRGSTKSSFISLAIIWQLVNNPTMHALALRQVADTLRDSVYAQLTWAINELDFYYPGLASDFKRTTSPLEITYLPTGQKIFFRGADDPGKIKSIKPPFGHIGIAWFEELDQFRGEEAIRKIEQSTIRGGETAIIFKSFNPPRTAANWANKYIKIPKETQYRHTSSYMDVPIEWLGKPWLDEADHLKNVNLKAYEHEYLGIANGTGGMVFENVQVRKITDEEIAKFDRIHQGTDWGYFPDPFQWGKMHYDAARRILYIFDELRMYKAGNLETYGALVREKGLRADELIIADSAEPKSISDYRQFSTNGIPDLDQNGNPKLDARGKPVLLFGPSCRGAEKGPESVKYSMKWLASLAAIVIDNERAPYHAEEFLNYELEPDPSEEGGFISEYPDKNNHCIDEVRYAMNLEWRRRGQ
jgi:PBSX family phage terminase large subunit